LVSQNVGLPYFECIREDMDPFRSLEKLEKSSVLLNEVMGNHGFN